MRSMMIAIKMTIVLTVLTGILYPLAMVGVRPTSYFRPRPRAVLFIAMECQSGLR